MLHQANTDFKIYKIFMILGHKQDLLLRINKVGYIYETLNKFPDVSHDLQNVSLTLKQEFTLLKEQYVQIDHDHDKKIK